MKVKIVPASTVEFAIIETENLLNHLKLIKESKEMEISEPNFVISDQKTVEILAEKVKNGQNMDELLNDLKKDMRRKVIIALIDKGYNTGKKIAEVFNMSYDDARHLLSYNKISITEFRYKSI